MNPGSDTLGSAVIGKIICNIEKWISLGRVTCPPNLLNMAEVKNDR